MVYEYRHYVCDDCVIFRTSAAYDRDPVSKVAQSCLTLCDSMDCSLSGSSVHGIFQARILEWVAISFSRDLPEIQYQ